MDKRLTRALETLSALEETGVTADDLRAADDALGEVGKSWIIEGGKATPETDHEAQMQAFAVGSRLLALAHALDALGEWGADCPVCGADLGESDSYPWHMPDEDCRAVRAPVKAEGAPVT